MCLVAGTLLGLQLYLQHTTDSMVAAHVSHASPPQLHLTDLRMLDLADNIAYTTQALDAEVRAYLQLGSQLRCSIYQPNGH